MHFQFDKLRTLLKSSLIRCAGTYGFFSLLNSAIPFFMLPVLTRYLTPEAYGYVATFNIMLALALPFIGLSFDGAYARAYFAKGRYKDDVYLGTVLLVIILDTFVAAIVLFLFSNQISHLFMFPRNWLPAAVAVTFANSIVNNVLRTWQVRNQPRWYGLFLNSRTLTEATAAIIMVVLLHKSWQGRITANLLTAATFAVLGLYIVIRNHRVVFKIDKNCLKHALSFGVPLIPHGLSVTLNASIGKILISHMVSVAETGVFTAGFQIGNIVSLCGSAFNLAYGPWVFNKLNHDTTDKKKIVMINYICFVISVVFAVALGFIAPYFMSVFLGRAFSGSYIFVTWVALGAAFQTMYFIVANFIFYSNRTYYIAIATVATTIINIIMNYIFIGKYGSIGSAQASTITYFIQFIFVWFIASKVYPMPWKKTMLDILKIKAN